MLPYCSFIAKQDNNTNGYTLHKHYHDNLYGFPISDDNELFARLVLEINQAGLSWTTILKKEAAFRKAYHNFDIQKVAAYQQKDVDRLLNDAGIIRNRLKINAAIHNANVIMQLQNQHGSFKNWLDMHHPQTKQAWVLLFKKHFKFTGGEIVNEFLMSIGYLPGAHDKDCNIFNKVLKTKPAWSIQTLKK
ncbi:DNA-3-methyladenine glycosylase I [Hydrotalea sandarakina]|jgi:DNA-3-methyladenine glycosylase I|uniref:DNA-3-methyladenine glycosylase I n=1 Tax=Hydrotalea sandarakina TaxID=1004304 RepID=A0A2W7RQ43_9BACT|nr:DNA-3-methyladenine glycosylase I [Hydrotalea sandarakina]PZX62943.1 DNA-3-methyladenine glycosylase I [Hydrotalea sandarakina]